MKRWRTGSPCGGHCGHALEQELRLEAATILDHPQRENGLAAIGFAEATLRHDNVNGCTTSPVAFLEGIFVQPDWRKRGVARLLCLAVERWAIESGCSELASDTELHNEVSRLMHGALGFAETERVVFFRKELA